MVQTSTSFIELLRAWNWLNPAWGPALAENPAAPWEPLQRYNLLSAEQLRWAFEELQRCQLLDHPIEHFLPPQFPPPIPPASALPSTPVLPSTPPTVPVPASPVSSGSPGPAVARLGELRALSTDDFGDEPTPTLALGAAEAELIGLIASQGMGQRERLAKSLSLRPQIQDLLGFTGPVSNARVFLESKALSLTELQQLATRTGRREFLDGLAEPPPLLGSDAEAEARLHAGQIDKALLLKARKAHESLAMLGIERPLANLIRHFENLASPAALPEKAADATPVNATPTNVAPTRRRATSERILHAANPELSSSGIARRRRVTEELISEAQAVEQHPVWLYCLLSFALSLGMVLFLFGDFKQRPKTNTDKPWELAATPPKATTVTPTPIDSKPKTTPVTPANDAANPFRMGSQKPITEPLTQPENKPVPNTENPQPVNPQDSVEERQREQARSALEQLLTVLRQGSHDQARALLKTLTPELQAYESALQWLADDLNGFAQFLKESFPGVVANRAYGFVTLTAWPETPLRPEQLLDDGLRCQLQGGAGKLDVSWSSLSRSDYYTLLGAAPVSWEERRAVATLALFECPAVGRLLLRDLRQQAGPRLVQLDARLALARSLEQAEATKPETPKPDPKPDLKPGGQSDSKALVNAARLQITALLAGDSTVAVAAALEQQGANWRALPERDRKELGDLVRGRGRKLLKSLQALLDKAARVTVAPGRVSALEKHREAALGVIFDTQRYPEANHGAAGQGQVDELVTALRGLWDEDWRALG